MKAWLIKWEWMGDHARMENPVVGIFSARKSVEEIKKFVEMFYATQSYSLHEMANMAKYNKPSDNPYPSEFVDRKYIRNIIHCGHNPFLTARTVEVDQDSLEQDTLKWEKIKVSEERKLRIQSLEKTCSET